MTAPIKVTESAVKHIRTLLAKNEAAIGLRLGTSTQGCNGLSYKMDYVEEAAAGDEVVEVDGVKVFIAQEDMMYLLGVTMDYEDALFSTGFAFTNPNENGRCGCGESFTV